MTKEEFVVEAYHHSVKTLLWSETISFEEGTDDPRDGHPFDRHFDRDDIAADALKDFWGELRDFVTTCWDDLKEMDPGQAGHDFVLTRNGHGTGFWDRGLGERGRRLTDACKPYGEINLYLGDDGMIYAS